MIDFSIANRVFNPVISESLLNGAMDAYLSAGGKEDDVTIYRVPGAYEIPGTVKQVLTNQSLIPCIQIYSYLSFDNFCSLVRVDIACCRDIFELVGELQLYIQ